MGCEEVLGCGCASSAMIVPIILDGPSSFSMRLGGWTCEYSAVASPPAYR